MKLFKGQMLLFWGLVFSTVIPLIGLFMIQNSIHLLFVFMLGGGAGAVIFMRYLDEK